VSPFVRKVKTASGATAVQIVEKRNGRRRILEHVGSAHDEAELAVLVSAAQQRVHGVQDDMLQFEQPGREPAGPVVEHASSELLWRVLTDAYARLGFDQIDDEVFAALAVARYLQDQTGVSIKRLVQTLRPLRTVTITIAGQPIQAQPRLTAEAETILAKIPRRTGH